MREIELLKESLIHKAPILVLGAGFSIGAVNRNHQPLLVGKTLANKLYKEMYEKCDDAETHGNILHAKELQNNLKDLSSLIRTEGKERVLKRNSLLTSMFSGCVPKNNYHKYIIDYHWEKIFTLNIDDLVENIYKHENIDLVIWNNELFGEHKSKITSLIKMHGCVNANRKNYVFDEEEYAAFMAQQNHLLREFADAALKHDVILVGTEFQEDDVKYILETYKTAGYKTNSNFYFISPQINSPILMSNINNNPNYHWINWNTEQFLNFIHNNVSREIDYNNYMLEKGMIIVDSEYNKGPQYYQSEIYFGKESRYADFWQNWSIKYPSCDNWIKKIDESSEHVLLCLYGKSYVGKTCAARHLLVELAKANHICREYVIDSTQATNDMLDYMSKFPQSSSFAILCENAAYNYVFISDLLKRVPANIHKCVVIAVDNKTNHERKCYDISHSNTIFAEIKETISTYYADNIIEKLKENAMMSNFNKSFDSINLCKKHCKKLNDIIEVLYFATSGRHFEAHMNDEIKKLHSDKHYKHFCALVMISALGINYISIRIFSKILSPLCIDFCFEEFIKKYVDWVTVSNDRIKIRGLRLISKSISQDLNEEEYIHILYQIIKQTVGQFNEYTNNEWSELFQKVLLIKSLISENILSMTAIERLFDMLECDCRDYSYYWVQRGILAQKLLKFEFAHGYLLNAQKIRENSYQVKHALAKNAMERGIFEYEHNRLHSQYYYDEGYSQMQSLLDDSKYSKAFSYSIHAMISMQIKWNHMSGQFASRSDCDYIVTKLTTNHLDNKLINALRRYSDYCSKAGYGDLATSINYIYNKLKKENSDIIWEEIDDDIVLIE